MGHSSEDLSEKRQREGGGPNCGGLWCHQNLPAGSDSYDRRREGGRGTRNVSPGTRFGNFRLSNRLVLTLHRLGG